VRVLRVDRAASMRPGRMPRKYRWLLQQRTHGHRASMRPGRMPRKYEIVRRIWTNTDWASMRPGRMPRKYAAQDTLNKPYRACFNEAGADAPEIPARPLISALGVFMLQ